MLDFTRFAIQIGILELQLGTASYTISILKRNWNNNEISKQRSLTWERNKIINFGQQTYYAYYILHVWSTVVDCNLKPCM